MQIESSFIWKCGSAGNVQPPSLIPAALMSYIVGSYHFKGQSYSRNAWNETRGSKFATQDFDWTRFLPLCWFSQRKLSILEDFAQFSSNGHQSNFRKMSSFPNSPAFMESNWKLWLVRKRRKEFYFFSTKCIFSGQRWKSSKATSERIDFAAGLDRSFTHFKEVIKAKYFQLASS